ncbi:ribosomal protein L15 [Symbiobacterium terraclitae]|uniref:Ribosomal protein L15 n=1 Tax=Symbiobacterium terraclitae TaxID=557451 RepID=A0ABS4JY90_9FIRM|nr:hypothetical protein [Symbiobacterium terraclitae]MBP2019926.1 ribosomal protein L15 [Symbiobacterium terraclitae]
MTEKNHSARHATGGRGHAGQPPGLDHGAASLVAVDSPDDPHLGAPKGQVSRNRPQTNTDQARRPSGKS